MGHFDFMVVTLPVGVLDLCTRERPPLKMEVVGVDKATRPLLSPRTRAAIEHIKCVVVCLARVSWRTR